MLAEIALFSVVLSFALLFIRILGYTFSSLLNLNEVGSNPLQQFVIELFIGSILFVTSIALFKAGIQTVQLIFIPVLVMIWYEAKAGIPQNVHFKKGFKAIFKDKRLLLLIAVLPFVTNLLSVLYGTSLISLKDIFFYGLISEELWVSGIENSIHHFNASNPGFGLNSYHYFEMWFTAPFLKLFSGYSGGIVIQFITYSFFKVFFFIGILSLVLKGGQQWRLIHILVVFGASLIPIDQVFNALNQTHFSMHSSFWFRPNFLTYVFVFIASLIFWKNQRFQLSVLCLLCLSIVSITAVPIVLFTIPVLVFYLYKTKLVSSKSSIRLLGYYALTFLLLLFFYGVFSHGVEPGIATNTGTFSLIWSTFFGHLKVVFFVITHHTAFFFILISLMYLIVKLIFLENQFYKDMMLFFGLIILVGIGYTVITMPLDNHYQGAFVAYSFLQILVSLIALEVYKSKIFLLKILVGIFVIIGMLSIPTNEGIETGNFALWKKRVSNFKSSSLIEYALKEFEVPDQITNELQTSSGHIKQIAFLISDVDEMQKLPPKRRNFIVFPYGLELLALGQGVSITSVTPNSIVYFDETPDNASLFDKLKSFNSLSPWYKEDRKITHIPGYLADTQIKMLVMSSANIELESKLEVIRRIVDHKSGKIYLVLK